MSIARRFPVTVTDVRHLASRCNANDNYCFQSMRVRRRHSFGNYDHVLQCWPLYRNICRIQDDRFYGDHLLKITREIFINAIPVPTREFGQFKVESCLLMRPKSNMCRIMIVYAAESLYWFNTTEPPYLIKGLPTSLESRHTTW